MDDYGSTAEKLLKRRSELYDIYFYDTKYSFKYGPYLVNLTDYLSSELINEYNSKFIYPSCYYKDKLVGLVIFFLKEIK